jgi:hypothetical protein
MPPRRMLAAVTLAGALVQGGPALASTPSPSPSPPQKTLTATSELPEDFGDAPESYHTDEADDGPVHLISPKLMLGTSESSEDEARGDKDGSSDDADDALTAIPPLTPKATAYHLTVAVTNRLTAPAVLAGWLDSDNNGSFERPERVVTPVAPGATSAKLDWTGLHGAKGTFTYLRLRLYAHPPTRRTAPPTTTAPPATSSKRRAAVRGERAHGRASRMEDDCLPVGYGGVGEVEDYRVVIGPDSAAAAIPSGVTFRKTADRYTVQPGDRVHYTITVTNNLFSPQGAVFTDYMGRVLDDARYDHDASASSGGTAYGGGSLSWRGTVRPNHPVTVAYSVTVRGRGYGNGLLDNRIVSNRGNCMSGSWDPFCRVRVVRAGSGHRARCSGCHPYHPYFPPTSPGLLPHTGAPIIQMMQLAGLLLVGGSAALLLTPGSRPSGAGPRRRRRRAHAR